MQIDTAAASPLQYDSRYENPEEDEAETLDGLMKALRSISDTTYKDSGHGFRSVHAKSHGLLRAKFKVLDGLPEMLAQGLFSKPGEYDLVMRFSTVPGDILDDRISTPRGLALKVIGVDGARLDGSSGDVTQDFVMVNGPVFSVSGPKKFLKNLKLVASTTDKAPGLKRALSALFRGAEKVIEAAGSESATLKALGGHPETNLLGETFYSQVPILFGRYMAKISVAPVSPGLTALTRAAVDLHDKPNGLRDAIVAFFSRSSAEWEFRVQLCTSIETMPVEDASVQWPEDQSPYIAVARITAAPQTAWSEARATAVDDGMAFSPWHGIAEHRPIGAVMRVRKAAYVMSSKLRADHNRRAIIEPRSLDGFPE